MTESKIKCGCCGNDEGEVYDETKPPLCTNCKCALALVGDCVKGTQQLHDYAITHCVYE